MDTSLFVSGMIIGFSIAAPVGPIGLLCIRRTLAEGRVAGVMTGMGAATADALYGCLAAFGLTFVSAALLGMQSWLRLAGGLFLCYLGLRAVLSAPAAGPLQVTHGRMGSLKAYGSTLLLTLTNPMTIIAYAAILAAGGPANMAGSSLSALVMVGGIFLGSAAWWLLLSGATSLLRKQIPPTALTWINRLAGACIFGFGLFILIHR